MSLLTTFYGSGDSLINSITPPTPVVMKMSAYSNKDNHTIGTVGDYLNFASSSAITRYTKYGVLQWTLVSTDIHASATIFGSLIWYDTVDDALWITAYQSSGTLHHLAKVDLATKAITNIGSFTGPLHHSNSITTSYTHRSSMGSGNFKWRFQTTEYIISSTTGAIVTSSTKQLGGVTILSSSHYETLDGTIVIGSQISLSSYSANSYFIIQYNGNQTYVKEISWLGELSTSCMFINWGNNVEIATFYLVSGWFASPKYFDRTDFDRYLHDLVDYLKFE